MANSPIPPWHPQLESILREFECQTGTIHQATADGTELVLIHQIGVPDFLLDKIAKIPFGKGIAGAAAATKQPVELCNLQADLGGIAKPDAQKTGVAGSLAVPIFSEKSGQVIGTLGIGKLTPHSFSDEEKHRLAQQAAAIALHFLESDAGR